MSGHSVGRGSYFAAASGLLRGRFGLGYALAFRGLFVGLCGRFFRRSLADGFANALSFAGSDLQQRAKVLRCSAVKPASSFGSICEALSNRVDCKC